MDERSLFEKLRKIEELIARPGTAGEGLAAAEARQRLMDRLAGLQKSDPPIEFRFSMRDSWSRQLFLAILRRYGLKPYRYRGQRYTTVMVRCPRSFVNRTLWPEYLEIKGALDEYLMEATERIIREEVYRDAGEAPERTG